MLQDHLPMNFRNCSDLLLGLPIFFDLELIDHSKHAPCILVIELVSAKDDELSNSHHCEGGTTVAISCQTHSIFRLISFFRWYCKEDFLNLVVHGTSPAVCRTCPMSPTREHKATNDNRPR